MTKNPKWFKMEEAIKTEDRAYWPYFYLGIDRIEAAKESEGNTEELQQLEKEWKLRWEEATPDPSENEGEREADYTPTPTGAGAECLERGQTPAGEDEGRGAAASL